ncbi:pyocin large subunit-like protein [Enterococcus sp. PF1-24]|uniref:hypothetical protein n=1 Tax=unclassified Enterococcus TaxID=2608891 RepID=UPI002473BC4A|nr:MULTISPECIES: hypothetical protein [unclassified Enterococcus]MDH6365272.1 pyocin large subunit-like protein [Enterococcus sp. PFB1-1]MDH6402398.1 pyocin large subunit-like protein [Enterococcus sp. PF1-24]
MAKNKKVVSLLLSVLVVALGWGGYEVLDTDANTSSTTNNLQQEIVYQFYNDDKLAQHFAKHKDEFTEISTEEEYLQMANQLLLSQDDEILTKPQDDGDTVYFDQRTNEFAVLSDDGVIRTYFIPEGGINYFNRQ